jgi:hypothetical protein
MKCGNMLDELCLEKLSRGCTKPGAKISGRPAAKTKNIPSPKSLKKSIVMAKHRRGKGRGPRVGDW